MAGITQPSLFHWQEIEELGDLERLQLLLDHLPDEPLRWELEKRRGNGRDDYPIRPLWNSLLSCIVFQHASIEGLRRELKRNGQLRWICGFDLFRGLSVVPPSYVYTRFLQSLYDCQDLVDLMFNDLVAGLQELLPDFGNILAIDGKAIAPCAWSVRCCPRSARSGRPEKSTSPWRRNEGCREITERMLLYLFHVGEEHNLMCSQGLPAQQVQQQYAAEKKDLSATRSIPWARV